MSGKVSFCDGVQLIKKTFSLTDIDMSEILGVTFNTYIGWLNTNTRRCPRVTSNKRYFKLYVITKDWIQHGYTHDRASLGLIHDALMDLDSKGVMFIGRNNLRLSELEKDLL